MGTSDREDEVRIRLTRSHRDVEQTVEACDRLSVPDSVLVCGGTPATRWEVAG